MYDITRTVAYLAVGAAFTVGAGWKLHRIGRIFLTHAFRRDLEIASRVNRMLLTSFCMVMAGYLAMTLNYFKSYANTGDIVGYELGHFGGFLLFLGFALFVHVLAMSRMRGKARRRPEHGDSILA